jgi:hypothetical protein
MKKTVLIFLLPALFAFENAEAKNNLSVTADHR